MKRFHRHHVFTSTGTYLGVAKSTDARRLVLPDKAASLIARCCCWLVLALLCSCFESPAAYMELSMTATAGVAAHCRMQSGNQHEETSAGRHNKPLDTLNQECVTKAEASFHRPIPPRGIQVHAHRQKSGRKIACMSRTSLGVGHRR